MFEIKELYAVGLAHKRQKTYYVSLHTFRLELLSCLQLVAWARRAGLVCIPLKKTGFAEILPKKFLKEPPRRPFDAMQKNKEENFCISMK